MSDVEDGRVHNGDRLYAPRRTLHTGAELLTGRQEQRIDAPFAGAVER
ncbi:hypothetical protein [Agrococcus sp. HG114]|nr:hypothetical protein [Agrococcus sp. HG114]MCR8669928.1 hypothetical protein [Agrococcus sp. HG114]